MLTQTKIYWFCCWNPLKSTRTRPDPRQLPQRDRTGGGRLRQGCRRSGGGGLGASGGQFLQQSCKYKISMNIIEYIYIYYLCVYFFLHRYNGMYIMLLYYIMLYYVILYYIVLYYIILITILFVFYSMLFSMYIYIHKCVCIQYVYIYISNTWCGLSWKGGSTGSTADTCSLAGSQTNSDGVNDRDINWTMFDTNIYHNYIIYIYVYDLYLYILYLYIHELYPLIIYIHMYNMYIYIPLSPQKMTYKNSEDGISSQHCYGTTCSTLVW